MVRAIAIPLRSLEELTKLAARANLIRITNML